MTRHDIIALGQARHGKKNWIGPLAQELGYSFSRLSRVVKGEAPVSRRMQFEVERVARMPVPLTRRTPRRRQARAEGTRRDA